MKKLAIALSVFVLLIIGLYFIWCSNFRTGKVNNVEVTIGESEKFSKAEIEAAIKAVKREFKSFNGCELKRLWYDEERSNRSVNSYLTSGKGRTNGSKEVNVIVLFSDFYVGPNGGDGSLEINETYKYWNWILIRDHKMSSWKVDDWGY